MEKNDAGLPRFFCFVLLFLENDRKVRKLPNMFLKEREIWQFEAVVKI